MVTFKRVGKLTQAAEELPFYPKRVYWIHTEGEVRGGHAHKKTQQVFTCAQGYYDFIVDNGIEIKKYQLTEHSPEGVYIDTEWHTMENCSPDCIILVFASEFCNEEDYIREYGTWKRWLNERAV